MFSFLLYLDVSLANKHEHDDFRALKVLLNSNERSDPQKLALLVELDDHFAYQSDRLALDATSTYHGPQESDEVALDAIINEVAVESNLSVDMTRPLGRSSGDDGGGDWRGDRGNGYCGDETFLAYYNLGQKEYGPWQGEDNVHPGVKDPSLYPHLPLDYPYPDVNEANFEEGTLCRLELKAIMASRHSSKFSAVVAGTVAVTRDETKWDTLSTINSEDSSEFGWKTDDRRWCEYVTTGDERLSRTDDGVVGGAALSVNMNAGVIISTMSEKQYHDLAVVFVYGGVQAVDERCYQYRGQKATSRIKWVEMTEALSTDSTGLGYELFLENGRDMLPRELVTLDGRFFSGIADRWEGENANKEGAVCDEDESRRMVAVCGAQTNKKRVFYQKVSKKEGSLYAGFPHRVQSWPNLRSTYSYVWKGAFSNTGQDWFLNYNWTNLGRLPLTEALPIEDAGVWTDNTGNATVPVDVDRADFNTLEGMIISSIGLQMRHYAVNRLESICEPKDQFAVEGEREYCSTCYDGVMANCCVDSNYCMLDDVGNCVSYAETCQMPLQGDNIPDDLTAEEKCRWKDEKQGCFIVRRSDYKTYCSGRALKAENSTFAPIVETTTTEDRHRGSGGGEGGTGGSSSGMDSGLVAGITAACCIILLGIPIGVLSWKLHRRDEDDMRMGGIDGYEESSVNFL